MYNMSVAVSYEVRAFYNEDVRRGVHGKSGLSCFSPVINIMRHPLWGRNQVHVCTSGDFTRRYFMYNNSLLICMNLCGIFNVFIHKRTQDYDKSEIWSRIGICVMKLVVMRFFSLYF